MKIKVIKNGYYVSEDVSGLGVINEDTFTSSFTHLLVVGDVWVMSADEFFNCVEGAWKGECNDGWWDYEFVKEYFEIL